MTETYHRPNVRVHWEIPFSKPLALSEEEIADFVENGEVEDLLVLDGALYYAPEVPECEVCGLHVLDANELVEDVMCQDCYEETLEERRHVEAERRWYRDHIL